MDEIVPLPLALLDLVPVICFMIGGWYLGQTAGKLCHSRSRRMALLGAGLVALGGAAKAMAKLGAAAGLGSLDPMGEALFIFQTPGFLLLLAVAIQMLRAERRPSPKPNPALMLVAWKITLIALMALAGTALHGILVTIALGRKERAAGAGFAVALLCLLAMGGAARGAQTLTMQWVEESINTLGQLGFAFGSVLLYRKISAHTPGTSPRPAA